MTGGPQPDSLATAIPIDELAELARLHAVECNARSESEIRECAEHVVRSKLCPCVSSIESIVDAVVEEFRRILRG